MNDAERLALDCERSPLDHVLRSVYADALLDAGDDAGAARQRALAGAVRRGFGVFVGHPYIAAATAEGQPWPRPLAVRAWVAGLVTLGTRVTRADYYVRYVRGKRRTVRARRRHVRRYFMVRNDLKDAAPQFAERTVRSIYPPDGTCLPVTRSYSVAVVEADLHLHTFLLSELHVHPDVFLTHFAGGVTEGFGDQS